MTSFHNGSSRNPIQDHDIYNCKQTLKTQRRSNEYLDNIFVFANAPMIVWDADFNITRFNSAFEKLTGRPADQIVGNHLAVLFPHEQIENSLDLITATHAGERWESVEIPILHIDGSFRTVLWNSATVFKEDGTTPLATVAQGIDITGRKAAENALRDSEERYRAMIEGFDGFMYICSKDLRIEFMNNNLIQRTGRNATGEYCYKALHNLDAVCEWCCNEHVFAGETVRWEIKSPKDDRWYYVVNSPVYKADGTISKQAMITDITDRKQGEYELHQAKVASESASLAKSAFLATMSHEIRTPLNAMTGNLTLLGTTSLTAQQQKCMRDCTSASQILLQVINDILDLSKIEAGKMELVKESYSPRRMIDSLVNIFACRAKEKQICLNGSITGQLPDFILGDRHRLSQIISNLLSNAMKFTQKGKVVLSASMKKSDQGMPQLIISVSDSGIGIPPEQQPTIFDRFTQLENFSTRHNVGTGLGLAICKRLVELMEGEISLLSTPGKGSIFTITIPAIIGETPVMATSKRVVKRVASRILMADDEPLGREVATAILERNGHTVKAVEDGTTVLDLLQRERFDILLIDISMPDMDGTQVAKIIRSGERKGINPLIPIIAVTAHAFPQDRDHFLGCGINGYISKPINFVTLLELIEETCGTGSVIPAPVHSDYSESPDAGMGKTLLTES